MLSGAFKDRLGDLGRVRRSKSSNCNFQFLNFVEESINFTRRVIWKVLIW